MATKKTAGKDSKDRTKQASKKDSGRPPWQDDEESDEDEDEESDEDEDEESDEDGADEESDEDEGEGEEDEDSDEDEEDSDEDEEEEEEDRRRAVPARRVRRRHEEEEEDEEEEDDADEAEDWLPDWAPWVVMLGLITVGLLGLLGVFSPGAESAVDHAPPPSSAEVTAHEKPQAPTPPTPGADSPAAAAAKVGASHVLIAYKGAMRAAPTITRTKEEAQKLAREVAAKAKKGDDFAGLAKQYSDGPTKTRGGALGEFTKRQMVKPFSDAAFSLKVGGIAGPVETPFGFHVIKRTK